MIPATDVQPRRLHSPASGQATEDGDHLRWFVRGSAFAAGSMVLNGALTLFAAMVFARWLGPAVFGAYSTVLVLLTLCGGLGAAGMDTAAARYTALYSGSGQTGLIRPMLRFGLRRAAFMSIAVGVILYILVSNHMWLPEKLVPIRSVALPVGLGVPVIALSLVLMQAILHFGAIRARMSIEKIAQPLLRLAIPFAIVFVTRNRLSAAVAGFVLATSFCGLASVPVLQRFLPPQQASIEISRERSAAWTRYALPFAFQSLQQFVSSGLGIEVLIVGAMLSLSDAGMYTAAFRFTPLLTLTRSAMDYAFGPKVGTLFGRREYDSIQALYRASSSIGLFVTLPAAIILLLFSRQFMGVTFGGAYVGAAVALVWLVCGCVIDSATGCNTTLLAMSGKSWLVLANNMLGGALTVLLCWVLIPRFGIAGAAFSVSSSRFCSNLLATFELWRLFGWQPFSRLTGKLAALAIPTFGIGLWIRNWQPPLLSPLLYLGFASGAIVLAYAIGLRVSRVHWTELWRSPHDLLSVRPVS